MQGLRSVIRIIQKQRDFLSQTGKGFSGFPVLGRNSSSIVSNGLSVNSGNFQSMPEVQPNFGFRKDLSVPFTHRYITTAADPASQDSSLPDISVGPRIKFKRLDKTARNIMQILDKEAVEEVRAQREIPDIRPGNIVELKVVVPENKRRVSVLKGIVIARRNAGLNSTFRIRRLVAGVGVESLFPLYSPNIKEIKIVDRKKVRRAKLYYLRDKMNALKKQ